MFRLLGYYNLVESRSTEPGTCRVGNKIGRLYVVP